MLTPHGYQIEAVDFLRRRLFVENHQGAGLFASIGAGKTLCTLLFLEEIKLLLGEQILLIAPGEVCTTVWPPEAKDWGIKLKFARIDGGISPAKRLDTLKRSAADVLMTTPDLTPWLSKQRCYARVLVVDESSMFKNLTAKRTRALRKMLPQFDKRIILTATPATNSYADLQPQILILDDGETLGRTKAFFNMHYMRPRFDGYGYHFREECKAQIDKMISPLIHRIDVTDHLQLPKLITTDIPVALPFDAMVEYKRMEKEMVIELEKFAQHNLRAMSEDFEDTDKEVFAFSAGAKYAHCKGVAAGGVYETIDDKHREMHHIHTAKVDALRELAASIKTPLLVFYQFLHSLERFRKYWPNAPGIGGGVSKTERGQIVHDWNAGKIPILFCQPRSMSHGLNMQKGPCKDMVWTEPTDMLETYLQANGRLYRQGQKNESINLWRLIATDTVEELMRDRLENKEENQRSLLDSLKIYTQARRAQYASCNNDPRGNHELP